MLSRQYGVQISSWDLRSRLFKCRIKDTVTGKHQCKWWNIWRFDWYVMFWKCYISELFKPRREGSPLNQTRRFETNIENKTSIYKKISKNMNAYIYRFDKLVNRNCDNLKHRVNRIKNLIINLYDTMKVDQPYKNIPG